MRNKKLYILLFYNKINSKPQKKCHKKPFHTILLKYQNNHLDEVKN